MISHSSSETRTLTLSLFSPLLGWWISSFWMLLLWLLLLWLLMLLRTPSIILVGNDMLGIRARMWRDEDTIYFYVCAFDRASLCLWGCFKEMCFKEMYANVTFYARARSTRASKRLTLMSTHLVQRRKKQLFYVCFNVCFREMWWYMCNVKFYAPRAARSLAEGIC